MPEPTAQSSIEIAAPAEKVYDLVADVPNVPNWAAEVDKCTWLDGADGPKVGAKFRGINQHKSVRWPMTCEVVDAEPGKRFAFDVKVFGLVTSAKWWYDIEPTASGAKVTEGTQRLHPKIVTDLVNRLAGIADRDKHNQANIEKTLAKLKQHAESS